MYGYKEGVLYQEEYAYNIQSVPSHRIRGPILLHSYRCMSSYRQNHWLHLPVRVYLDPDHRMFDHCLHHSCNSHPVTLSIYHHSNTIVPEVTTTIQHIFNKYYKTWFYTYIIVSYILKQHKLLLIRTCNMSIYKSSNFHSYLIQITISILMSQLNEIIMILNYK